MIDIILSDEENYSTLFSYAFGGVLALAGIVASILLFLIDRKIGQASNVLDNLIIKIADKELKYKEIKFWIKIYTDQWNKVRFNKIFRFLLYLFFISSFFLVFVSLYLLFDQAHISFLIWAMPIIIFLLIVYEIIEAPNTLVFKQWRPHELIKNDGSYKEIAEEYLSFLDIYEIMRLENETFRHEKHFIRVNVDKLTLYIERKLNSISNFF